MRSTLLGTVLAGTALLGFGNQAQAAFTPTDGTFYSTPSSGTLSFTFEGFSAGDTDNMALAIDGNTFFINKSTAPGTVFTTGTLAAGTYKLQLTDMTVHNIWSSDPALNSDLGSHLASSTNYSDFHIGAPAVVAGTYYGWEDRPLTTADRDYNDLVFAVSFAANPNTPVPEPVSLSLLGAGLVGVGLVRRLRKA